MMAEKNASERCANYETNLKQCPCPNAECERHGVCCECVGFHTDKGGKTRCMKGMERPAETMGLPIGRNLRCANRARNESRCACTETGCARHGICCDCIRYHWGHKVWPTVGCM